MIVIPQKMKKKKEMVYEKALDFSLLKRMHHSKSVTIARGAC